MTYELLSATETVGPKLVLSPGGYEFQVVDLPSGSATLEFLAPDGSWVSSGVELSADGVALANIPSGSLGVRAVSDAAGATVWLMPLTRSSGG